jgi:tRNA nucleotidyltransferase/poly(A) polymerase
LAKTKCQVEVATFRTDGSYSDGRRPDWVVYATAEQDAQRRDFTINGLFYDPIAQRVIDFVGGQIDLGNRLLRAIGDPYARINEDKLRMLRAIRFAARFALELDPATRKAIEESASGIQRVSGERIGMELSKILENPNRQWAWSELERCGLLAHIAPELLPVEKAELFLQLPDTHLELPVVLAAMVHPLGRRTPSRPPSAPEYPIPTQAWRTALEAIQRRWKLPNATIDSACVCVEASCALANPKPLNWSEVQPKLLHGWIDESMHLAQALCRLHHWPDSGIQSSKDRLAQPTHLWNPEPWIKGSDLIRAGLKPGPAFGKLLSQARSMQLDGQWTSEAMALEWLASAIQEPERYQRPEQEQ